MIGNSEYQIGLQPNQDSNMQISLQERKLKQKAKYYCGLNDLDGH